MFVFVTTEACDWSSVMRAARRKAKLLSGASFVIQPARLTHKQEGPWIETVLEAYKTGSKDVVVASSSEVALLCLLHHVGRGDLPCEDLHVYSVSSKDLRAEYRLRVSDEGEFIDIWPDGFFNARYQYLFGSGS